MMRLELNSCPKYVERRKFLFLFFQLALFIFLCSKSIQFCQSVEELFFLWVFCALGIFCVWVALGFFFVGVFVIFLCGVGFWGAFCLFVWSLVLAGLFCFCLGFFVI